MFFFFIKSVAVLYYLATWLLPLAHAAADCKTYDNRTTFNLQQEFEYECNGGSYELTISWIHDPVLESQTSFARCYNGFVDIDPNVIKDTGIHAVSIDYGPGYPIPQYSKPQYFLHTYRNSLAVRETRTCTHNTTTGYGCITIPGDNPKDRAFFNVATVMNRNVPGFGGLIIGGIQSEPIVVANMPDNFVCLGVLISEKDGIHCLDPNLIPASPDEYKTPALLIGSYDGEVAFLEPIGPVGFVSARPGYPTSYESGPLKYNGQTIMNLPSKFTWNTDPTTKRTTFVYSGTATNGKCADAGVTSPSMPPTKRSKKSKNL